MFLLRTAVMDDKNNRIKRVFAAVVLATAVAMSLVIAFPGCGKREIQRTDLILATTTSVQDTGLLDEWIPMFEEEYPYSVKVIAVGSGKAMEMGRNGEADVMIVHSPKEEERFIELGYGIGRRQIMHNYFIIVGPPSDPAGIKGMTDAADAFKRIAQSSATFISRGDGSGTHIREESLWESAIGASKPITPWYVETGKGMGDTLRAADQKQGYTLSDRATFALLAGQSNLVVMVEGDPALLNIYSIIEVNPGRFPNVKNSGAQAFAAFVLGRRAQELLERFGVERYGEPLFCPDNL